MRQSAALEFSDGKLVTLRLSGIRPPSRPPAHSLAAVQFSFHVLLMSDDGGEGGRFLFCFGFFLSYQYG